MDKKLVMLKLLEITSEYERVTKEYADSLIFEIKKDCATYGDVADVITQLEKNLRWDSRKITLGLVEQASDLLEKEKSRLSVASSFSD